MKKRYLAAALVVAWVVPMAVTASASTTNAIFTNVWVSDNTDDVVPQWHFDDDFPTGAARSRVIDGSHAWNDVALVDMRFDNVATDYTTLSWDSDCSTYTGYQVDKVGIGDFQANHVDDSLAVTKWCATANHILKNFRIKFSNDYTWWTSTSTAVPSTSYDMQSVAAHEFGHAAGAQHFAESSSACPPSGSLRATMCPSTAPGSYGARTLTDLEVNYFQSAYAG